MIGELLKYRPSLGILPVRNCDESLNISSKLISSICIILFFHLFFQNGESALHAAALSGHMSVARQLVGAGADPLLLNQEGVTPLQIAIRHSQTQVIDYLTDKVRNRTASR